MKRRKDVLVEVVESIKPSVRQAVLIRVGEGRRDWRGTARVGGGAEQQPTLFGDVLNVGRHPALAAGSVT